MVTIRQTQLIPLMKKAGYAAVDSKGTCNGIACVAAQSFLLQGNLDAFSKRLDFIEKQGDKLNENFASIKGKFNKIGEARKKHQPITPDLILTNEEKAFRENYIDVMAFYDSVRLYQAPHEFRNLFNRRLEQQHTVEVAQFTSPLEINSKPNAEQLSVAQVGTSINVYSANEVKQYFQDLQQRLDAAQENIALLMGPPSHAISVLYDAKNRKWTIADANTEGMVKSISADLPYMLAQEVLATAYNMNNKRDEFDDLMSDANKPNFLLGITALSRSDKASEMTDLFNQFKSTEKYKKMHALTEDKLTYRTKHNKSLFNLMIQTDIPDPLLQHPEYASSVLKMSHDWFAHSAVLNGATKVVDALGEFQEKFIKRIPWTGGDTCAHAAVRQNNIDMLKVLLKHNPTLLNKRNYFGKTPFGIAKRGTEVFDYLEAIKLRDRLIKKIEKKSRYMPDADASAAEKQAVFTAFKEADQKNNWREFSEQYPQFKKQIKGQQFHQVHPVRRKIGALFRLFKDKVTPKRYQSPTDESKMRIKKKI